MGHWIGCVVRGLVIDMTPKLVLLPSNRFVSVHVQATKKMYTDDQVAEMIETVKREEREAAQNKVK